MKRIIVKETTLRNIISESVRRILKETQDPDLWVQIRFVQGGDEDYDEISDMFCGEENRETAYCAAYSQPVIDYLKQWDGDLEGDDIVQGEPHIARHDTVYHDENGPYILRYNSGIGGDFLLYRPAEQDEIDWYYDNH